MGIFRAGARIFRGRGLEQNVTTTRDSVEAKNAYVCNDGSKKSDQVKDLITCVVVNSGKMFCTMLASLCGCTGNFLATLPSAYRPDILGIHRHMILRAQKLNTKKLISEIFHAKIYA